MDILLQVYNEDNMVMDASLTLSEELAKRELKLETLDGEQLEIEFKFKQ